MSEAERRVIAPTYDQFVMWARARGIDPRSCRYVSKPADLRGIDRSVPIIVTGDLLALDGRAAAAEAFGFTLDWQETLP